jgi:uncharacterized protein YwgA
MNDVGIELARVTGALEQVSKTAHNALQLGIDNKSALSKHEEGKEHLERQIVRHSERSDKNNKDLNDKIDKKFSDMEEKNSTIMTMLQGIQSRLASNKGRDSVLVAIRS